MAPSRSAISSATWYSVIRRPEPVGHSTVNSLPKWKWYWSNARMIRASTGIQIGPRQFELPPNMPELAIGQTLTDHDVPLLGDFTYYAPAVVNTPLSNGSQTGVTLTSGLRTHLGNDWCFLAGLPIPLTNQRVGEIGMISGS
jgi:hypothetical protein